MIVGTSAAAALAALGLPQDADERAVRQAYAQRLKQIDQAAELPAFQALREAYEAALTAVRSTGAEAPTVQPSAQTLASALDEQALDHAALDAFEESLAHGLKNRQDAAQALRQALDRLSLNGSSRFEVDIAQRLIEGWRLGHEFLFEAASDVFGWDSSFSGLRRLGEVGDVLQAAMVEAVSFNSQSPEALDRQRWLLRRLRNPQPPTKTLRRDERPLIRVLVSRYPHWLGIVAPMDHIEKWLGGSQAVLSARDGRSTVEESPFTVGEPTGWHVAAFALWLCYMLWEHFG